jgi:hypothetical protein
VSHANAALTPRARLKLARLIVDQQWPVARAAERYDVSWPTAKRWADRYRQLGPDGMADRSSRPHRSPGRTPQPLVRKVVHLRWKHRLGPVQIAARTGLAPSTVHAVLVRCRLSRLAAPRSLGREPRAGCRLGLSAKGRRHWRHCHCRSRSRRSRNTIPPTWLVVETSFYRVTAALTGIAGPRGRQVNPLHGGICVSASERSPLAELIMVRGMVPGPGRFPPPGHLGQCQHGSSRN